MRHMRAGDVTMARGDSRHERLALSRPVFFKMYTMTGVSGKKNQTRAKMAQHKAPVAATAMAAATPGSASSSSSSAVSAAAIPSLPLQVVETEVPEARSGTQAGRALKAVQSAVYVVSQMLSSTSEQLADCDAARSKAWVVWKGSRQQNARDQQRNDLCIGKRGKRDVCV